MTGTAVEEIIGFPALNFAVNKHHAMSGQRHFKEDKSRKKLQLLIRYK